MSIEAKRQVVEQYKGVVGALNIMFEVMDERSEVQAWREDGIGSCILGWNAAEIGFFGPAGVDLVQIARGRNSEVKGISSDACPYHRVSRGCTQGDVKNSVCAAYIDYPDELNSRFKIDGKRLSVDIFWILMGILKQEPALYRRDFDIPPSAEEFYELSLDAVRQMTEHIRSFPVLRPEERLILNGVLARGSGHRDRKIS